MSGAPKFTDTLNPRGNPAIFRDLLGQGINVNPNANTNLDLVKSDGHFTTGIPYAISGQARLVQTAVTEWLASYTDPVKLIMGTHIQKSARVVVKRKHVIGQAATLTPVCHARKPSCEG